MMLVKSPTSHSEVFRVREHPAALSGLDDIDETDSHSAQNMTHRCDSGLRTVEPVVESTLSCCRLSVDGGRGQPNVRNAVWQASRASRKLVGNSRMLSRAQFFFPRADLVFLSG
jgi:hypothetical protein